MELIVNVLTDYDALFMQTMSDMAIERCNQRLAILGISIRQESHVTCKGIESYEHEDMLIRCKRDDLIPDNGLALFFSSIGHVARKKFKPLPHMKPDYYHLHGRYWKNCVMIFNSLKNEQKYDGGGHRLIDTVILHEIGHHFGLEHSEKLPSMMYPVSDYSVGIWSASERKHIRNWYFSEMRKRIVEAFNTED